ncbi:hypothetical protein [Propioniciclava coleopterorum]|uniref:hypothetical protein n=1 Tax=Propioniciclava coleopterorum TaxID=2714937 RepID=UPI001FE39C75|nr:hypothetical protein [Propioniciclava coleopterorum]
MGDGRPLAAYLDADIFADAATAAVAPDPADAAGFDTFLARYRAGLPIERAAVDHL